MTFLSVASSPLMTIMPVLRSMARQEDYAALSRQLLSQASSDSSYLPLARVSASGELPLQQGVHPHWADQLAALQAELSAVADSGWQGKTSHQSL